MPLEVQPRRRLYVDTSAYLCILLGQPGFERLTKELGSAQLLSSVLLVLETGRNLIRLTRTGTLSATQYKSCTDRLEQDTRVFVLRDVTLDVCRSAAIPAVTTPRSIDLAHLRTAIWFHTAEAIDRFVTMDAAQEQDAKELGLPV